MNQLSVVREGIGIYSLLDENKKGAAKSAPFVVVA